MNDSAYFEKTLTCLKISQLKLSDRTTLFDQTSDFREAYELLLSKQYIIQDQRADSKMVLGWQKKRYHWITYYCERYPAALREIPDPPLLLFYQGDPDLLLSEEGSTAVVGSRNCSPNGKKLAGSLARELAQAGQIVVSGLAYGIDEAAHQGCLEVGSGRTIAVLGNALPQIYPAGNRLLAKRILQQKGLIISQFRPEQNTRPANFLNRNRVVAALGKNLFVIEAGQKSGSLVSARYCLQFGKDLWVFPGGIDDPRFAGSNRLIRDGAGVVTSLDDLKEIFPKTAVHLQESASAREQVTELTSGEAELLGCFSSKSVSELSFSEIAAEVQAGSLHETILSLVTKNLLFQTPGNRFRLIAARP